MSVMAEFDESDLRPFSGLQRPRTGRAEDDIASTLRPTTAATQIGDETQLSSAPVRPVRGGNNVIVFFLYKYDKLSKEASLILFFIA